MKTRTTPRKSLAILGLLALLVSMAPASAAQPAALGAAAESAAEDASCPITPGVDDPTYNNVCPDWVSPITRAEIHNNPTGLGSATVGWFTRTAPNGEYLVTAGQRDKGPHVAAVAGRQMVLVATQADTGERLWVRHYTTGVASPVSAPGFVGSVPLAVTFSPDSRYLYVAGWTLHPHGTNVAFKLGFALKADAATGDIVWATTIGDLTKEPLAVSRDIAVSPDGSRVYVTGDIMSWADCVICHLAQSTEGWPPRVPFAVALDASSGDVLWHVDDAEHAGTYGWRLALSPDGSRLYQVQSLLYPSWSTKGIRLVAYDTATGEQVWVTQYDYPPPPVGMDRNPQPPPLGVLVSPSGDKVFVTTSHLYWRAANRPVLLDSNFLALAWDTTSGDRAWTTEYDWSSQSGCINDAQHSATGAALSPAGSRLYVFGSVTVDPQRRGKRCEPEDPGNNTVGLLALDTATGEEDWSSLYHNQEVRVPVFASPVFASFDNLNDIIILADSVHTKPGRGPGDEGSQVYVGARAWKDGDTSLLGLGFDGLTGRQLWQARHYPTGEPPDPIFQGSALSPDGGTFFLTAVGFPNFSTVINVAYPTAGDLPTAALTATPASGAAPLQVSFDSSGSRANNGGEAITRYRFDFGDGSDPVTQTSPTVTHTYGSAGTYTATVTVADSRGAVAQATETITATTGPGPEPTPTPTATGEPTPTPTPSPSESPAPDATDVSFTERSATSGQYSDKTLFEARLDDSNGDPIEGAELTFELTGAESSRSFTEVTGEDGLAAVTPTLGEKPGPYQLTVRYAGDGAHEGSTASATSGSQRAFIDRQIMRAEGRVSALVHVREETPLARGLLLARAAGAQTGTTYDAIKVFVAYGSPDTFKGLAKSGAIEYIEANKRLHYFTETSHKATRGQDVLDGEVTLPDGTSIDGAGIGVAVVDSGVDGTHPDLADRMGTNVKIVCSVHTASIGFGAAGGFRECLGPKTAVPLQDTDTPSAGGHGTHVAGIVAGTGAASNGTYHGAAPGATLYGVSVGTALVVENALDGLAWVLENHDRVTPEIRVVNNSWGSGYSKYDPQNGPFHKATWKLQEELIDAGVSVVFAAGNASGNGSASTTSAECINPTPGIVCVANYNDGGTGTRSGSISATSSRGKSDVPLEWPDISAPGTNIESTCRVTLPVCHAGSGPITTENNYRSLSGTSMAAPHVAGIIAQIYQADPTLTPAEVENHLEDTAHKFSFGSAYGLRADPTNPDSGSSFEKGHGLVDAVAALSAILNEPEASPTPSSSPSATATPSPTPTGTPPGDQGSTDTMSFVVDKEDSALELTEEKGKDKALVARLYDADTTADGIEGRTIDFYAGAELLGSAITGEDGVATFEPPKQKGKREPYEARFEGDDFYLGSSGQVDKGGKGGKGGGSGGGGGNGDQRAEPPYAGKVLVM